MGWQDDAVVSQPASGGWQNDAIVNQPQPKLGVYQDIAQSIPGTPVQPTQQPEPSWKDKARAGIEAAGGMIAGSITAIPSMVYGVGRDIYGRTIGDQKGGVSEAGKYAEQAMQQTPFLPKTELGQEYLGKATEALSVIPPVVPELNMLRGAGQAANLERQRFANVAKVGGEITPEISRKQSVFAEGRKYN